MTDSKFEVVRRPRMLKGSGFELLAELMGNIDEPAAASHEGWRKMKHEERQKPDHPYRGLPPEDSKYAGKRTRVRDLSPEERAELKIPSDADPGADVFHHWDRDYAELAANDTQLAGQNALWAWTVLNVLAKRLTAECSIAELEATINGLIKPGNTADFRLLRDISYDIHVAWGAARIMVGDRSPKNPDLQPYHTLVGKIAALDQYGAMPVMAWILRYCEAATEE